MCLVVLRIDSTVQNLQNMFNRAEIGTAEIPRQVEVGIPPLFALFSTHSGQKNMNLLSKSSAKLKL